MSVSRGVLLIANNFPPIVGGSASVYANLARCEQGRIIVMSSRIDYLTGKAFENAADHDRGVGYKILRLPLLRTLVSRRPSGFLERMGFRFEDLLIRSRLFAWVAWARLFHGVRTICIGELFASAWLLRPAQMLLGLRTMVYVHGEEITIQDSYDYDRLRARRALKAADAIVVVSRFTLSKVLDLIGHDGQDKVTLIENGLDRALFTPGVKNSALANKYGIENKFVFVSVCRLLEKKGIDNALHAFATIAQDCPKAKYLIVGQGSFEPELRSLSASLGLQDRVFFTGRVPDDALVDHYRLGDVFLMPNRRMPNGDTEGFGLVFLEANGCGLPVIAGQDGGSTDAVTDGMNGLVVDGSSVPQIAAAMRCLHDEPQTRERLSKGGLARAAAAGWDRKSEALMKLCDPKPKAAQQPSDSWLQIGAFGLFATFLIVLASPYILLFRVGLYLRRQWNGSLSPVAGSPSFSARIARALPRSRQKVASGSA